MKIIIIGAGISGLSTYLSLHKHKLLSNPTNKITIYEAYDIHNLTASKAPSDLPDENTFTPTAIGNALGVSANGLNVLRRLDDGKILANVLKRGNAIKSWRMSNARGWTLAHIWTVPKSSTDVRAEDRSVMISRQDLWEILRDAALEAGAVVIKCKITAVVFGDGDAKSKVFFDDGEVEEADLIIGADGLRSVLRRSMFGDSEKSALPPFGERGVLATANRWAGLGPVQAVDYITPRYEGLAGFGGFIPTKELQQDENFDPKVMNIVFGPNGFFGYGCISSSPNTCTDAEIKAEAGPVSAWWSTFPTPNPYPFHTTTTNPSTPPSPSTFSATSATTSLLTRHKTWSNPTIQSILTHTKSHPLQVSQFYPTYTTPQLPTWHKHSCVLVGDAAHTLQPSSGQGASLALEDSEALALFVVDYLRGDGEETWKGVERVLEKFEALRMPRVRMIREGAERMAGMKREMGFVGEMFMYGIIWIMSFFPDRSNDVIVDYDLPAEVEKAIAAS